MPGDDFAIIGEYNDKVDLVSTEGRKPEKMTLVQVVSLQGSPDIVAAPTQRPSPEGKVVAIWADMSLSSNTANADVTIDGTFYGNTPLIQRLAAGEHIVLIEHNGYKPWTQRVRLPAEGLKINAEMEAK